LIVAKGRKETVGRPMMYGTSKEFLLNLAFKDLSELPNVEDFEESCWWSGLTAKDIDGRAVTKNYCDGGPRFAAACLSR